MRTVDDLMAHVKWLAAPTVGGAELANFRTDLESALQAREQSKSVAFRKPLTEEQIDERAWLVEWRYNGTQWLYLTGGSFNFTSDPNKALRFARRADAEVAMAWAIEVDRRRGLRPTGELLVAEHEWIERAHGIGDE